jgi:hypothetical protein
MTRHSPEESSQSGGCSGKVSWYASLTALRIWVSFVGSNQLMQSFPKIKENFENSAFMPGPEFAGHFTRFQRR